MARLGPSGPPRPPPPPPARAGGGAPPPRRGFQLVVRGEGDAYFPVELAQQCVALLLEQVGALLGQAKLGAGGQEDHPGPRPAHVVPSGGSPVVSSGSAGRRAARTSAGARGSSWGGGSSRSRHATSNDWSSVRWTGPWPTSRRSKRSAKPSTRCSEADRAASPITVTSRRSSRPRA